MSKSLRCPAGTRSASIAVHRGVMSHPGLKIEALRRFEEGGYYGIGLKMAIVVPVGVNAFRLSFT